MNQKAIDSIKAERDAAVRERDAMAEALREALEALEWVVDQGGGPSCEHESGVCFCRENTAINAARAALKETK